MNSKKVLFITDDLSLFLFNDLCNSPNVKTHIMRLSNNKLLSCLRKIHLNKKLAKVLWLPYRDVYFDKASIISQLDDDGILLINSRPMTLPTKKFWHEIKAKKPNAKFVLILVDSMHVHGGHMPETIKRINNFHWDKIISYDKFDCEEFGFDYLGFNYYSVYRDAKVSREISDLYYVSSVKKGKEDFLRKIDSLCKHKGIKNNFQIYSLWRNINYGKCIRHLLPYREVVSNVLATNCILEILQDGQKTQSIRYLEAVCYNKKLLTNNKGINELPYYDPRYMKSFETIDDIDWDWICRKEKVDYGYRGDFSSSGILDLI